MTRNEDGKKSKHKDMKWKAKNQADIKTRNKPKKNHDQEVKKPW